MKNAMICLGVAACLPGGLASASTPSSWDALDRAAQAACKQQIMRLAPRARIAAVRGRVSGVGLGADSDRYYALVLRGSMAGFASEWLCLYDKTGKRAAAREIEQR